MRILFACAIVALTASSAMADDYVHGYTRQSGTQVDGYYRTHQDNNQYNNYSATGNINPYTGTPGHVTPDQSQLQAPGKEHKPVSK